MKPLPVLAIVAVIGMVAYGAWHTTAKGDAKPTAQGPAPTPVSTATATVQDVPVYLRGIGTVQALNAVEIHPQVGGILTDVPVKEGQDVKTGDVIAVIDPRPLKAALDRAIAQRTQDQAQLSNAKLDQQRYSTLATRDFASRQQLDTQVSTVARLEGVVAADEASIEEAQINLGYSVIHSPLDGRVSLRRVDPGNLIQANATGPGIFSIAQVRPISVVFTLPEDTILKVREAMAKRALPVLADSSDGTQHLAQGTLQTADNAINTATGTIQFKASFENADDHLTPGQFVSTRLQIDTAHGVTVPHEAIQHSQDGLFVFAVTPDKTAERRDVKLLYDDGKTSVVADGVKDGDRVVTSGQSRVGPGTALAFRTTGDQPQADQSAIR
jgi:multidrug efflux system membrane fusion protein